jgi:hypothetical protein
MNTRIGWSCKAPCIPVFNAIIHMTFRTMCVHNVCLVSSTMLCCPSTPFWMSPRAPPPSLVANKQTEDRISCYGCIPKIHASCSSSPSPWDAPLLGPYSILEVAKRNLPVTSRSTNTAICHVVIKLNFTESQTHILRPGTCMNCKILCPNPEIDELGPSRQPQIHCHCFLHQPSQQVKSPQVRTQFTCS